MLVHSWDMNYWSSRRLDAICCKGEPGRCNAEYGIRSGHEGAIQALRVWCLALNVHLGCVWCYRCCCELSFHNQLVKKMCINWSSSVCIPGTAVHSVRTLFTCWLMTDTIRELSSSRCAHWQWQRLRFVVRICREDYSLRSQRRAPRSARTK